VVTIQWSKLKLRSSYRQQGFSNRFAGLSLNAIQQFHCTTNMFLYFNKKFGLCSGSREMERCHREGQNLWPLKEVQCLEEEENKKFGSRDELHNVASNVAYYQIYVAYVSFIFLSFILLYYNRIPVKTGCSTSRGMHTKVWKPCSTTPYVNIYDIQTCKFRKPIEIICHLRLKQKHGLCISNGNL